MVKWTARFLDRTSCLIQFNGIDSESVTINSADCKFCFAISVDFLMFLTPRKHGSLQYGHVGVTINKGSERIRRGLRLNGLRTSRYLCVRTYSHILELNKTLRRWRVTGSPGFTLAPVYYTAMISLRFLLVLIFISSSVYAAVVVNSEERARRSPSLAAIICRKKCRRHDCQNSPNATACSCKPLKLSQLTLIYTCSPFELIFTARVRAPPFKVIVHAAELGVKLPTAFPSN